MMMTVHEGSTATHVGLQEFAERLGVSLEQLRYYLREGRVPQPAVRLSQKRILWSRDVVDTFLAGEAGIN